MKLVISLFLIAAFPILNLAQDDDGLLLGKSKKEPQAALYDISDPEGVNITVNLWGFVRYPGRYIVPIKTSLMDLLSYAGGPVENSDLKEIRIIRNSTDKGEKPKLIKLDYDDLLWKDEISKVNKDNPQLISGDIILIMEEKRYFFREDIGFYLAVFTTLLSMTTLIITLTKQ